MLSIQAEVRSFELQKSYTTRQKSYLKHTVKVNLFVGLPLLTMIKNSTLAFTWVFSLSLVAGIDAYDRLTLNFCIRKFHLTYPNFVS